MSLPGPLTVGIGKAQVLGPVCGEIRRRSRPSDVFFPEASF